ncbi:MAG: tetratricopeptide repeat protein [bacterium]
MAKCVKCGRELKEGATFCTGCGTRQEPARKPPEPEKPRARHDAGNWKIFGAVIAGAALIFGCYTLFTLYSQRRAWDAGHHNYNSGNYIECSKNFAFLTRKRPRKAENWAMLGECLRSAGKLDDAAGSLEKALRWHAGSTRILTILGNVKYDQKDYKAAGKHLKKVLKIEKNNYNANRLLGLTLKEAGDTKAAVRHLERALPFAPRGDVIGICSPLGELYNSLGKHKKAAEFIEKAITAEPNDFDLRVQAAGIYLDGGNLEKAREHVIAALKKNPKDEKAKALRAKIDAAIEEIQEETYLENRRRLDERYMALYTELNDFITKLNKEMDKILGKTNPDVERYLKESDEIVRAYRELKRPDRYYNIHTLCMANAMRLNELVRTITDFIQTGKKGDRERLEELSRTINIISMENEKFFEMIQAEKQEKTPEGERIETGEEKDAGETLSP